jgi:predicted TPR repeat methyltransferase
MNSSKEVLRTAIGGTAEFLLPHIARQMDEGRNSADSGWLKRQILHARLRRAQGRGDEAEIVQAFRTSWRGAFGDKFHSSFAEWRFNLFLESHVKVVDALDAFVKRSGAPFSHLVEIGCGSGAVLAYCRERLAWATDAIGLDISGAAIARASAIQRPDRQLAFACIEACDWLRGHPRPGTAVISYNGVLEYLSQAEFDDLLGALALAPPAALVLVEPVDQRHELDRQPGSFMFGDEGSFSHNHRSRLEKAGFEVVFSEEGHLGANRAMLMLGARL